MFRFNAVTRLHRARRAEFSYTLEEADGFNAVTRLHRARRMRSLFLVVTLVAVFQCGDPPSSRAPVEHEHEPGKGEEMFQCGDPPSSRAPEGKMTLSILRRKKFQCGDPPSSRAPELRFPGKMDYAVVSMR